MTLTPRARRILVYLLSALVPLLLFANVLQGMRYTRLEREVRRLEDEQLAWFERNKTLLAAIGIYSSPRRLQDVADGAGGEANEDEGGGLRIRVEGAAGEGADGR